MIDTRSHEVQQAMADYLRVKNLPKVNQSDVELPYKDSLYSKYGKRILDLMIAVPSFVITLPINLALGVLTYVNLGRPIFFKQERVGKNGKPFSLVKFRNMTNETDEHGNLLPAADRTTRFGTFVRKTSLDELMNFLPIIKGEMSIIGPRPLPPVYNDRYSNRHAMRLRVKPGLECPPPTESSGVRTWHDRFENDVWYVQNISLRTDCRMVLRLFRFTFDRRNAKSRAEATVGSFVGYSPDGRALSNFDIDERTLSMIIAGRGEQAHASKD